MLVFSEKITVSQILKFQQQLIEAFLNSTDMSEENKESPIVPISMDSWVEWFRSVAPHIHSIRGKTIVIDLAGETILCMQCFQRRVLRYGGKDKGVYSGRGYLSGSYIQTVYQFL